MAALGEAEYNSKIIALLKKLPEPQGNNESNEDGKEIEPSDNEEE